MEILPASNDLLPFNVFMRAYPDLNRIHLRGFVEIISLFTVRLLVNTEIKHVERNSK